MRKKRIIAYVLLMVLFVCVAFSVSVCVADAAGVTRQDEAEEDDAEEVLDEADAEDDTEGDFDEADAEDDIEEDFEEEDDAEEVFDEVEDDSTPTDAHMELATSTDAPTYVISYDDTDIATDSTAKRANTTVEQVNETATETMTKVDAGPDSGKDDAVKTGDEANVLLCIIAMLAVLLLLPAMYINKKDN